MSKLTLLLVAMLSLSACDKSQEFRAYEAFRSGINEDYSRAAAAYKTLSEEEKAAVYLGANELHPPDTRIADLAFEESIAFVSLLRDKVKSKDNYVATFDYVNEVKALTRAGKISSSEAEKLELDNLCRSLTSQSDACLEMLKAP